MATTKKLDELNEDDKRKVEQAKQATDEERMENVGESSGVDTERGNMIQKPGIASDQPGAPASRQPTQEVRGDAPPSKSA